VSSSRSLPQFLHCFRRRRRTADRRVVQVLEEIGTSVVYSNAVGGLDVGALPKRPERREA
jgi:hypothetical protein